MKHLFLSFVIAACAQACTLAVSEREPTSRQGPVSGRMLMPGEPDVVLPDPASLPFPPDAGR